MRWRAHLRAAAVMTACAALAGCGSSSSEVSDTGGSATPSSSAPATAPPTGSTPSQPPPTTASGTSGGTTTTATPSQTGGTPAGGAGGSAPARQTCGSIAFAPASSHGAFEITVTGSGCPTAQGVASVARTCFGCDYRAAGFSCRGRRITTGLIRVAYTCTNGAARISFVRG